MKYFLSHRFNERDGILSRGVSDIALTRKAAGVLRCLIDHAGTLVPHETILSTVWRDSHVQSNNIKVLVRELRQALGDDPRAPRYIRSEPGRGYMFVAPLHDVPSESGLDDTASDLSPVHVNHHQELSVLADALAAASLGDCRVVVIEGERGTGKTTLCDAFLRYASSLPAVRVCYGQCLQHGSGIESYFPVLDALHHLARQSPAVIEPLLARHAPAWMANLRPWLADGIDTSAGGAVVNEPLRMIREFGSLLERLALDTTSVIVLDDLQWGDVETIELLQGLMRRRAHLRTMVVVTSAPFPPTLPGTALRNLATELWPTGRCTRLSLEPLNEEQVRTYLVSRFGAGDVALLAHTICRLTGGNPLAIVSTMDALVTADIIWRGGTEWRVRHPLFVRAEGLPQAVLDAIGWRFTHLGSEARGLIERAAAVGSVFSAADVAVAAGAESLSWVERGLEALCARHFVERLSGGSLTRPHGGLYGFLHPLHAELLVARTPASEQLEAVRLLAADADRRANDRCG